jgi:hypothetical protein
MIICFSPTRRTSGSAWELSTPKILLLDPSPNVMSPTTIPTFSFSLSLALPIKDGKIVLMSPAGLRPIKTALAMPNKLHSRPLVREGATK